MKQDVKLYFMRLVFIIPILCLGSISKTGYAKPVVPSILTRNIETLASVVVWNQVASGATDALNVAKVKLAYFTSSDCSTGSLGSYTTPLTEPSFPISINTPFSLVASSTWDVGVTQVLIGTMTSVQSVAITLFSTANDVPQANFTGSCGAANPSSCCIAVTCSGGECLPSGVNGQQNFQLKTTAAIGDPADGGVIACMDATIYPPTDGGYLVTPTTDNSASIKWDAGTFPYSITNASSLTDGATNTATIVTALSGEPSGTYAASLCNNYSTTGGYITGWFLPSQNQLNCLNTNKSAIPGFANASYWSSTEVDTSNARSQNFSNNTQSSEDKGTLNHVRCVRQFTPLPFYYSTNKFTTLNCTLLAGAAITNTGVSAITENVCITPGVAITGLPNSMIVNGDQEIGSSIATTARASFNTISSFITALPCGTDLSGQDLGGKTLSAGTYCFSGAAGLTGTLTLTGAASDYFYFQIGGAFNPAASSNVVLSGGITSAHIFWNVQGATSVGANAIFKGNILSGGAVTIGAGSSISGKLLAGIGPITLDTDSVAP